MGVECGKGYLLPYFFLILQNKNCNFWCILKLCFKTVYELSDGPRMLPVTDYTQHNWGLARPVCKFKKPYATRHDGFYLFGSWDLSLLNFGRMFAVDKPVSMCLQRVSFRRHLRLRRSFVNPPKIGIFAPNFGSREPAYFGVWTSIFKCGTVNIRTKSGRDLCGDLHAFERKVTEPPPCPPYKRMGSQNTVVVVVVIVLEVQSCWPA